jgi:hypothetical protein
MNYYNNFKGYFPWNMFHEPSSGLQERWYNFSYGLLRDYNWENTVACGAAVRTLVRDTQHWDEHIYLIIYSRDYRKVRQQLGHLFWTIKSNAPTADIGLYIQEGIIVVNIRGMVRKICILVEYNNDPFWAIYSPRKYFNTHGSLYDGEIVHVTVDAAIGGSYDRGMDGPTLSSLDQVMGYSECIDVFSKRIGCGIVFPDFLLKVIYPYVCLRISERKDLNDLKKNVLLGICNALKHVLDIEHTMGRSSGPDVVMELVSDAGSVPISTGIVTLRHIFNCVTKVVYIQPLHLYPKK